ncbi:Tat pathway signal protein [Bradyrhizobium sp. BR 10289]|uniref:Acg family FMN-binding oxidoreductase n=1 Tax=Bradyrhizobium sp. BR 10289 TaxID=2749993 RepID=UPI001C646D71|nr:Tat pathway signal protein [Bradyrhizobium sp. BR 10289]MBW7971189.1 nitroreductase family protein [Bradyrhizobium sp. BR 10289]
MPIDRRDILRTLLGVGVGSMSCASPSNASTAYEDVARAIRAPLLGTPRNQELVRFACLAANSHNTQPWTFKATETRIRIAPDYARRTPAVDPDDHHLFVSLGCAAENLILAASALGLRANAHVEDDVIAVDLEPGPVVTSALFEAIRWRQCTRAKYDGQPVAADHLGLLEKACAEQGVSAIFMTDKTRMANVADYVLQGNSAQMRDKAFMDELVKWMRFSETDAAAAMDGLFSRASGNPALPGWIARPLLRFFLTESGENQKYREHIESSAGVVVLTTDTSNKAHWVAVGRACQRFGLQATALGLKYAFINQPVEVAALRAQFVSYLGIGDRRPDIVMRFGAGPDLPKSLRRPPQAVMAAP